MFVASVLYSTAQSSVFERRYIAFYFIPHATDSALGSSKKDFKQLLLNTDKIFYWVIILLSSFLKRNAGFYSLNTFLFDPFQPNVLFMGH